MTTNRSDANAVSGSVNNNNNNYQRQQHVTRTNATQPAAVWTRIISLLMYLCWKCIKMISSRVNSTELGITARTTTHDFLIYV